MHLFVARLARSRQYARYRLTTMFAMLLLVAAGGILVGRTFYKPLAGWHIDNNVEVDYVNRTVTAKCR